MCLIAQIAKKEEKNKKEGKRNKFWNIFYLYVSLSLYSLNTKPVSSVYSAVMVFHQVKVLKGEGRGKENTFFAFPFPPCPSSLLSDKHNMAVKLLLVAVLLRVLQPISCTQRINEIIIIYIQFKADRQQMIVVAKKYICVATVHQ